MRHYHNKLFEVAIIQTLKPLTMTSLILSHLVNGVVYCVEVLLLCELCETELILASATLCIHTLEEVCLGIPNYLTEELCELSSVLCLLPSVALVSLSDLWITLAVCLTAHSKVHTYLCTLTHKVVLKTLKELCISALAITEDVLCYELKVTALLLNLYKLICRNFAKWATLWCLITLVNITAYCATNFLSPSCKILICYTFVLFPTAKVKTFFQISKFFFLIL